MQSSSGWRCLVGGTALLLALAVSTSAQTGVATPAASDAYDLTPTIFVPPLDLVELAADDDAREAAGLPPRFAVPFETVLTPDNAGRWEALDGDRALWRLRVQSPDAPSLNFGFTRYDMPADGRLSIFAVDGSYKLRPFTADDNEVHGQLWTPVVLTDDVIIEVVLPLAAVDQLQLELTSINVGYRLFGQIDKDDDGGRSGSCNIDVVCPQSAGWEDQIQSVGVISTGGSTFCTGFAVNNTAEDRRPYFMTAYHCGITTGSAAASLVVYWNFESPNCGQQGGGSLSQFNTGSFLRATYSSSDFTLVELDDEPLPEFDVVYAGWDNSGANATSAVAIHHPSTDEKSISWEYDPTTTTSYLGTTQPGDGTHVRITDWDVGTTEPGSSGSPVFDQNQRVIGQLHGGYAACGNDDSDWYGKFSVSWTGGGSSNNRLRDWLDPINSGANVVDALPAVPRTGLRVSGGTLTATGPNGGPFTPPSITFTLTNQNATPLNYSVTDNANWLAASPSSGTLAGNGTVNVTVSITSAANSLANGVYDGQIQFLNTTDGDGDAVRLASLEVGIREPIYVVDMSTDPGWTKQGQWAYGKPNGLGGEHGNNDPTSGYTGQNVYGYNLNGDYTNNMPEYHLTSTPFDCTAVSGAKLRFRRWLNVERPAYDHAYVRVSTNGSSWTTVWENAEEITDATWQQVEYDISAVADGQSTVYLRWTMGSTDSSWLYSGWNIDDVEIIGFLPPATNPADLDGDNCVDFSDFAIFSSGWGGPGGDIDGDQTTDFTDFALLTANWGAGCP